MDFVRSVDSRKVNKKVLEALIKAGAFDFTKESRVNMLEKLNTSKGLFSGSLFDSQGRESKENVDISRYEKEVLGFYISKHPVEPYEGLMKGRYLPLEELENIEGGTYVFMGVVSELKEKRTQKGGYMAIFNIIDKTGIAQAVAFPDVYEKYRDLIKEDAVLVLKCDVEYDEEFDETKLTVREVYTPSEYIKENSTSIRLIFRKEQSDEELKRLKSILLENLSEDGKEIVLEIRTGDHLVTIQADPRYRIRLRKDVLKSIKALGVDVKL